MAGRSPAESGLLVIGSSQAGVALATSLRSEGFDRPITLLGDENHRPYRRPALSKEWLQGAATNESLVHRSDFYWADQCIDLVRNERIVRIDRGPGGSGVAHAVSGAEFAFDRLALAVGARPRRLLVDGADLPGVLYLRNADEALELRARARAARDVVVIGGGFIGIEAAVSLHTMGLRVTLLEAAPRLAGRIVGEQTAAYLLEHHRAAGIDIVVEASVSQVVGRGDRVTGVRLVDGRVVPADLVLVGIGVVPNTELAEAMGLACDDGILVDEHAIASDGHTLAVGDCSNQPNPVPGGFGGSRVRLESVNNAIEQARAAANAVVGTGEERAGIPWFWSNQGKIKLQVAGLARGHDRTLVRAEPDRGRQTVLYYRGDQLLAADCVNHSLDFLAARTALSERLEIPFEDARDPAVPLASVTVAPAARAAAR